MKHLKTFESIDIQFDLEKAVHQNNVDLTIKALSNGANPNIKDKFDLYLLSLAVFNNNIDIVKELIKAGSNLNVQNKSGFTPLIDAARDRGIRNKVRKGWEKNIYEENILEELIKAGANWNIKNVEGEDFFDFLIDYFREPIIDKYPKQYKKYLIKKNAEKYNL